jgi:hypothetical protein
VIQRVLWAITLSLAVACSSSTGPSNVAEVGVAIAEDGVPTCTVAPSTRLYDGIIFIEPGEVVCARLELNGGVAIPAEIVGSRESGNVLVLKSWTSAGAETFLSVHNPFRASLKYRAGLLIPGEQQFRPTSSCTVLSERFALEHWPYSIAALALTDFRVLPEGDESMVCE